MQFEGRKKGRQEKEREVLYGGVNGGHKYTLQPENEFQLCIN